MDRLHLSQHISQQFNSELEDVRRRLLAMGGLVEEQMTAALRVLIENDVRHGQDVYAREQQVNAAELAIDEQCTIILARRQPAASDLRLVLSIMKMLVDLERIGDEAKRIERLAEQCIDNEPAEEITAALAQMATDTRDMLRGALDAFARVDADLALDIMRKDHRIDATYARLLPQLIARMQQTPERIAAELNRLWIARSFERIGDRCRNLCEHILYLIRGTDVRHSGLAKA